MLAAAVHNFDGHDPAALKVAARVAMADDAPRLMDWAEQGGLPAEAATWVIKAMVETGRIDGFDAERLIAVGRSSYDWQTCLHLLQLAQHWPAMADLHLGQTHLHHAKPMVRTWALDTFVRACLAGQGDSASAQIEIDRVLETGKASEKARARALLRLF